VVLLVSAGMLGHTLLALSSLDPGFNVRKAMAAHFALSPGTSRIPKRSARLGKTYSIVLGGPGR